MNYFPICFIIFIDLHKIYISCHFSSYLIYFCLYFFFIHISMFIFTKLSHHFSIAHNICYTPSLSFVVRSQLFSTYSFVHSQLFTHLAIIKLYIYICGLCDFFSYSLAFCLIYKNIFIFESGFHYTGFMSINSNSQDALEVKEPT